MFRKKLVSGANAGNTMQIMKAESGCCGDAADVCKYRIVVDPFVDLASITIEENGVEVNIPFAATVTDLADLPAAIATALATYDYISDGQPTVHPVDVEIVTDGTERTIDIWSEAVIVNLISSAPVTDVATALCAPYVRCFFSVVVPYGAIAVSVDGGADEALANSPYAAGAAAAIKTDILASTALGAAEQVTVTENTVDDEYTITFYFTKAEIEIGGVMATRTRCRPDYEGA